MRQPAPALDPEPRAISKITLHGKWQSIGRFNAKAVDTFAVGAELVCAPRKSSLSRDAASIAASSAQPKRRRDGERDAPS
jgi:hypothetical protein